MQCLYNSKYEICQGDVKTVPGIEEWDNELPTLIVHGVDDSCDSGLVHFAKWAISKTAEKSNKNITVECISEGRYEALASIFTSMKQ